MGVHDVFISYSSADRDLAGRVHEALLAAELTVWRDRDRLDAGLRFTPRIFDALRESRICLCLVSESYLRSGYANQELGAARGYGVRLFPVRVGPVGDRQLVGVLSDVHVPALGDDIVDVEALVHELVRTVLGAWRRDRGCSAPPAPRHLVERCELRQVLARLIDRPVPWLAIVGRPGSGRSTFAAALASAMSAQVDGRVFWVEPNDPSTRLGALPLLQQQLLDALTDATPSFGSWQEGRRHIRRHAAALAHRARSLLVIDDADIEPDVLAGFDIGPQWTVIAVGQDAGAFAATVAPDCVVKLGEWPVDEAERLVAKVMNVARDELGVEARRFLDRVDRLPSVVTLAAMLARASMAPHAAWNDLLEAWNEGALDELDHPALPGGGARALVHRALRPLDPQQIRALSLLSALPDRTAFDQALLHSVWRDATQRHARARAARLRELSLLDDAPSGVQVPSLVRAVLRTQAAFVRRYVAVLAQLYPQVGPLAVATFWNDLDVFERLALAGSRSRRATAAATPGGTAGPLPIESAYSGLRPLHFAAQNGRTEMVATLLRVGASIDAATEPLRQTALHLAIHHRRPAIVALLLDRGADPGAPDHDGYTPLHIAAQLDDAASAARLLERGADTAATNRRGNQPLHVAAALGAAQVAQLLVRHRPRLVDEPGQDGATAVLLAAHRGHAAVLEVLLAAGADPDRGHASGETPLLAATRGRHEAAVEALLAAGADVHALVDGITALFVAVQEGYTLLARRLLRAGADPSGGRLDGAGSVALHAAAASGCDDAVRVLLDAGARTDAVDDEGRSALHYAAQASVIRPRASMVLSFTEERMTALAASSIVVLEGPTSTLDLLLQSGVPVDAPDNAGNTALHVAAAVGGAAAVRFLLAAGADPHRRNLGGLTAADAARRAGFRLLAAQLDDQAG